MSFTGLVFEQRQIGDFYGYDLALDNDRKFKIDDSVLSNVLSSLFLDKQVTITTISTVKQFGGWAGSEGLAEADVLGSDFWYETQQNRLSSETKTQLETTVFNALAWLIEDGYATALSVTANSDNRGGTFYLKVTVDLLEDEPQTFGVKLS